MNPAHMSPSVGGLNTSATDPSAGEPEPVGGRAGKVELGGETSVNRLGFGAMRLPGVRGLPKDPHEAHRLLRRAIELGVEFIDTAHAYGPETSERLIAAALHPYPQELILATKGGYGPSLGLGDGTSRRHRPDHR